MRPEAMAVKEAEKMLIQFGGEAAIAPLDPPSEVLGESK
jgi:hypothetical protein